MHASVIEAVRERGPAPADRKRERCPLCASERLQHCLTLPHNPLLKCADCGLSCTERIGSDEAVAEYYRGRTAHAGKLEEGNELAAAMASFQAELLSRVISHEGGRLLELGCAAGNLLAAMEQRGWQCWGVELSETSLQAASSTTHATLHLGTLDNFSHPLEDFDCIAAFDLLAHLTDPVTTLRQAASLLRPGGWLVLSTVNEGWPLVPVFQRLFSLLPQQTAGLRDEMYEAQHYAYFNKSTLTRLMREAGLDLHTVEPLAPFSAQYFRHQYRLTKRLALTGMLGLDRLMGASRKMLVAARKPLP